MTLETHSSPLTIDPALSLPDGLRPLVNNQECFREFGSGEILVGPGKWDERIRFIVSGELSLVLRDDEGQKMSVDRFGPGDIFGEVDFFTGSPWPSDSELLAEHPGSLLCIPSNHFERMLREDPAFTIPLVKKLVRRVISLQRTVFQATLGKRALKTLISRQEHVFPDFIGGDFYQTRIATRVNEIAQSDAHVLIMGESGVGKEGVAHAIFRNSHNCKEVFLQADIRRLVDESFLSGLRTDIYSNDTELTTRQERLFFGTDEPGRAGIARETPGYFELTDGGTLLVRGIEHVNVYMQKKLLESIMTGTFRRQGGVRLHKSKIGDRHYQAESGKHIGGTTPFTVRT